MPAAHTVWPDSRDGMLSYLTGAGLQVSWQGELTRSHRATVHSLVQAFTAGADQIREHVGASTLGDLQTSHRLWSDWLQQGRVRKFAFVAKMAGR